MAIHLQSYRYSVVRYEPQDLVALGDYMYERGTIALARRIATDTADRVLTWRYSFLWKKMPDGAGMPVPRSTQATRDRQPPR